MLVAYPSKVQRWTLGMHLHQRDFGGVSDLSVSQVGMLDAISPSRFIYHSSTLDQCHPSRGRGGRSGESVPELSRDRISRMRRGVSVRQQSNIDEACQRKVVSTSLEPEIRSRGSLRSTNPGAQAVFQCLSLAAK
jgi:hypothetical protein